MAATHDLLVIGAGPGGYVAAIRAAQLGLNVGVVEKEPALGGTCLRVGCIPSKALLESSELYEQARQGLKSHGVVAGEVTLDLPVMLARKDRVVTALTRGIDSLFQKHKITRYLGHARITGPGKVEVAGKEPQTITPRKLLIATGSVAAALPGVELDGDRIGTSTEALSYPKVPGHLVVIGAGAIGLELGSVWRRLGSKVTVVEYLDRILPGMDGEIAVEAHKLLEKQGLQFRLGSRVTAARKQGAGCVVECQGQDAIPCDRVLLAVGRKPNTQDLGLASIGLTLDARGRIPVDAHFETAVPGVFAIGDVIPGPMLAHKAEDEGVACAEYLATGHGHVNHDVIPSICYTHPEIAAVGKTEEELKAAGIAYRKGSFPFLANGRARALAQTEGRVKMLAHADTDRVLGVHILGPRAGDLIAECAAAMEFGASSEDIARTCHAHPTLAEVVKESALAVLGRALHM